MTDLEKKIEEIVGVTPLKDKPLKKLGITNLDIVDMVMHLEDIGYIHIDGDIPEESILDMTTLEFKDFLKKHSLK